MKKITKLFAPYLLPILVLVTFVWGQAHVNLTLPDYMSKIVNEGILLKNMSNIWDNGTQMLAWTLFGGVCAIIVGFIASRVSTGFVRKLRHEVFEKVENFSLGEFDKFSASSLVTRATNDMQQIQNVIAMVLRLAFLAPFMGVGAIFKAYDIAPSMSWIVFVAIGILITLVVALFIIAVPKFTRIQSLVDKLSLQMREMLTGIRVIRAYNNDKYQQKKFDKTNLESTKLNVFVNRIIMLMQPVMTMIMGLASMAVVWAGAYQINDGNMEVGNILALMQYVMQTIMAFLMISVMFIMIPRAVVSLKRIGEVLDIDIKIKDPSKPIDLPKNIRGEVKFDNVSFGYGGSEHLVLSDISFTAEPGQTTAIIGGTGSGKSTILKLIPRLYDATDGSVMIDGVDVRNIRQKDLRTHIGYTPQKASLFSGTVSSNIKYGKSSAKNSELEKAIEIAQAKEFVDKLPEKFDSHIAQAGGNISGGQKQRLSIARALAKDSEIYLFDDSFSALDFKTDAALRKSLELEMKSKTMIIVAQRISTIMNADKIVVIDDGRIVGIGKHSDLMKTCKVYSEIANSQLSASELSEGK